MHVFDTDAQPDQVLGQASFGPQVGRDRSVAGRRPKAKTSFEMSGSRRSGKALDERKEERNGPHQAGHADERVDSAKADANPKDGRPGDDPARQVHIGRLEAHDRACTRRL